MKNKMIYVSLLALIFIFALQGACASDTDLNNVYSNDLNLEDSSLTDVESSSSSVLASENDDELGSYESSSTDLIASENDDELASDESSSTDLIASDAEDVTPPVSTSLDGDDSLNSSEGSLSNSTKIKTYITVPTVYSTPSKDTCLKIYLKDENGNAIANKPLTVKVNQNIHQLTTDKNGFAKLGFPKKLGTYDCVVKFDETADYYGASANSKVMVLSKIPTKITAPSIKLKSSDYAKFEVKLTTPDGAPLKEKIIYVSIPEAKKVFKIKTNSEGIATLKYNAYKTFKVVVKFKGGKTYKACSIKSKIIVNKVRVKFKDVVGAACLLDKYIFENRKLPSNLTYKGKTYTTSQLSYLMAVAIKRINKKNHKKITLIVADNPKDYSGEIYDTVYKKDYLKIVKKVIGSSIKHKTPKYVKYSFYKIPYKIYTAGFAKVLSDYNDKKKLPNYCLFTKAHFAKVTNSTKYTFYLTSDNIAGKKKELKMLKRLAKAIKSKGYNAVIVGIGPDIHNKAYRYGCTGKDSVLLAVFGGVDVGCIEEWTGDLKSGRIFRENYDGAHVLGLWFCRPYGASSNLHHRIGRAWDANYGFALSNPAKYMSKHGISYIRTGKVATACKLLKAGKMGGPKLIK